ncbi:unnamed protein product, partial [Musa hybrid cultivar]
WPPLPRCPRRPLSSLYPVAHPTLPRRNPSSSRSTVQTLPSPCASSPLFRPASPRPPRSRIQRRLRSTSRYFGFLNFIEKSAVAAPSSLDIEADADRVKIRIKLRSYWVPLIEDSCKQILEAARTMNAKTMGPVPLPTKRGVLCPQVTARSQGLASILRSGLTNN